VLLVELPELRCLLLVGLQVLVLGLPVRRGALLMGRGELLNINLTRPGTVLRRPSSGDATQKY
jgi:hypothetical protein